MARRDINIDEYRAIFGDSDDEDTGDIEGDSSDIDFEGIEDNAEESDEDINEETANEGAAEAAAGSDEEEEEEEEETWTAELSEIDVADFSAESGIAIDLGVDPKADNFFTFIFDEDLFDKIVVETNRYARQKLAGNEQRLARWRDVNRRNESVLWSLCHHGDEYFTKNRRLLVFRYFCGQRGSKASHAEEQIRRN